MKCFCVSTLWLSLAVVAGAQTPEGGGADADRKRSEEAIRSATLEIEANPKNIAARKLRARHYERLERYAEAAADCSAILALDKSLAEVYQQRGLLNFKMGKVKDSIVDFDRYISLEPKAKISHWQRGISYYYAGRYEDGRKQFAGYQDFDSNDVENAVWRFMCMARQDGLAAARKGILTIGDDRRVPMRQVYDLFKGDLTTADVLKAAKAKNELFYAHLYVGIYHDLLNDKKAALTHLNKAVDEYRIGHYMWDVARIHRDLLAQELQAEPVNK